MLFNYRRHYRGQNYGIIITSKDTIAKIYGLQKAKSGEVVADLKGNLGLVLNLEKQLTGVVTFFDNTFITGEIVFRTFKTLQINVNPLLLGNVFNTLGQMKNKCNFLDTHNIFNIVKSLGFMFRYVEIKAPGIISRQSVYEPLYTGFIGVDGLLPLGRGQRELIIGDRQTGKTAIAIDSILNQSNISLLFLRYFF